MGFVIASIQNKMFSIATSHLSAGFAKLYGGVEKRVVPSEKSVQRDEIVVIK